MGYPSMAFGSFYSTLFKGHNVPNGKTTAEILRKYMWKINNLQKKALSPFTRFLITVSFLTPHSTHRANKLNPVSSMPNIFLVARSFQCIKAVQAGCHSVPGPFCHTVQFLQSRTLLWKTYTALLTHRHHNVLRCSSSHRPHLSVAEEV